MNNRIQEYINRQSSSFQNWFGDYSDWTILKKLLITLIPSVVFILLVTGYLSNWFSSRYLNLALDRNVRQLAMAQASAIEDLLERCRIELLILERGETDKSNLYNFLLSRAEVGIDYYRELAVIEKNQDNGFIFLNTTKGVVEIPFEKSSQIQPDPIRTTGKIPNLEPGSVYISDIIETYYPPGFSSENSPGFSIDVVRLITPHYNKTTGDQGYLLLSIDARALRDVLSLYNSQKSPLYAYSRSSERRYSFFFDELGWILFQSENFEDKDKELSTEYARTGFSGDHGRPGQATAFRPHAKHEMYWKMISDILASKSGLEMIDAEFEPTSSPYRMYYLGYTPVRFNSNPGKEPEIIGGVAYIDRSLLLSAAQFRQLDLMSIITIVSVLLVSMLIYLVSRAITKPINRLVCLVSDIAEDENIHEIELPDADLETTALKHSINALITKLKLHREELKYKQAQIENVKSRQKIKLELEEERSQIEELETPGIVGKSLAIRNLRGLILKAAKVDADVLVIGDTGTGKELTSLAIHKLSSRRDKPFISINCGALDENLLLDSLFGHVKGAFSEAKGERKGAFLAAQGGTLMLDEIGNASAKVQQALLRALAVRKIRPLGADSELDFDVRVIAATNVDLKESVKHGEFREDLYYRLRVISIFTPKLSQHSEDIPQLSLHFLNEAANYMKKGDISLSRGALEALKSHPWKGNVRELKNTITTAVALTESDTIYAEDLKLDYNGQDLEEVLVLENFSEQLKSDESISNVIMDDERSRKHTHYSKNIIPKNPSGLSPRQTKALEMVRQQGEITRVAYQEKMGVPLRTAQYDLSELVKKGLLIKSGKGPSTSYREP